MIDSQVTDYLQRFEQKKLCKPACCHVCNKTGHLRWHGSYRRSLIALARIYKGLPVRRLLCTYCKHTFALLPLFIAKFHRYAQEVIHTAVQWLKTHTFESVADVLSNKFMTYRTESIATLSLYLWRRKFGRRLHP